MNHLINENTSVKEYNPSSILNNQISGSTSNLLPRIQEALNIVHGQSSSNESRNEASVFLEQIKADEEAPGHGFTLASDNTQQPIIRYFALSLLEHAIKFKWSEYSEAQLKALRQWVLHLAQNIQPNDPVYLRNKTAQLWADVAKRSPSPSWKEMDEMAIKLWHMPDMLYKEFVLSILEILSDEVLNKEDTVSAIHGDNIRKSCMEIFTPADAIAETSPDREGGTPGCHREQGWLIRIAEFLDYMVSNSLYQAPQALKCILRILLVFKSVVPWAVSKAIVGSSCVRYLTKTLALPNVGIQLASVEALHSLFNRLHISDEDFLSLICQTFTTPMVDIFLKLFEWSLVDPHAIDDEKYLFAKKFSEMVSILGALVEQNFSIIPEECDVPNLFKLLLAIAQSQSLLVSISVLHVWTRLLRSEIIAKSSIIDPFIAPLLQLASSRLIRYDVLPEDSEDPSMIFLHEDIDTIPERHAFLGNYRRFSVQIIELIVRQKQSEAIYHILRQADNSLQCLYDGKSQLSLEAYSKTSLPVLRVDAYFVVVEAALRGYMKSRPVTGSKLTQDDESQMNLENYLEAWCERLLSSKSEDPVIRKRVNQLAVAFSTSVLDKRAGFMLKVLEHILLDRSVERPEYVKYSQAVKEMQSDGMYELQRLAMKMPDHLIDVYSQLEETVNGIIESGIVDKKRQLAYQSFLFTIIHRNIKIDAEVRFQKLVTFVEPVCRLWHNQILDQALSSFDGFSNALGLDMAISFLRARRIHEIQDWSLFELDAEGYAIKQELEERLIALPLQATKSFLQSSTNRLEPGTLELRNACSLWKASLPVILPHLLKFLRYAHAVHHPANWAGLPPEMKSVVSQILLDRFWQAGISEGSKEEFYAHVSDTKSTIAGLASSIRASLRSIRETAYGILHCMSKFGEEFYGISDLPGPLAHSLFADASFLSSHQLINLIQVVRLMIEDCPVGLRNHFVPPILSTLFTQIDMKCTSQWEMLTSRQGASTPGENLTDEMKEESLLRQLTHVAILMIGSFLDPLRNNNLANDRPSKYTPENAICSSAMEESSSMRDFCLASPSILGPTLLFLTHAIRMRDTRCCGIVLRIFRSIIPEFSKDQTKAKSGGSNEYLPSIREFICRDVLMACISSLNESYFVELQIDIAHCIVSILVCYRDESTTARNVLLSIPNIHEDAVEKCLNQINQPSIQTRHQRALVLELLSDIKGVSISEQGRIQKPTPAARKERSKMQQEYMNVPNEHRDGTGSPILEFVADMFTEK